MRPHLLRIGLIVVAVVATYSNSLRNGFVWDDHTYIERNAFAQDPRNLKILADPRYYLGPHEVLVGQRPIFLASLMLDRALWGDRPAGYHATDLLLHAADSALVYGLAAALELPPPLPLWAGLLFGLHPAQTEAVDLAGFRAEPLAAFFYLIALLAYVKSRSAWAAACALPFGLALLSKETAATLPAMLLLVELFFPRPERRRARLGAALAACAVVFCLFLGFWAPRYHQAGRPSPLRAAVDRFAAAMPTAPGRGTFSLAVDKTQTRRSTGWEWAALAADRGAWSATMTRALAAYFRLLAFPAELVAARAPEVSRGWGLRPALSLLFLLAVAALSWTLRRRDPASAFGAAWCLVALLPFANVVPLYLPVAERYLYLVTPGFALAAASSLTLLGRRRARAAAAAGTALALLYAARTWRRNADWRDDRTLFLSAPADAPLTALARYDRGDLLRSDGRAAEAVDEYRKAVELQPDYAEAWLGLGAAYASLGEVRRAASCHDRALALAPDNPVMSLGYGIFLERIGRRARAAPYYERCLKLEPGQADCATRLAAVRGPR